MFQKTVSSALLIASALFADPLPESVAPSSPVVLEPPPASESLPPEAPPPRNAFGYMKVGASAPLLFVQGAFAAAPNISVGRRRLNAKHTWDYFLAGTFHPFYQIAYGQVSYLFYPQINRGAFVGLGLRAGGFHFNKYVRQEMTSGTDSERYKRILSLPFLPYLDLPFTFGYQFRDEKNPSFLEFQVTPLLFFTGSYGFSF